MRGKAMKLENSEQNLLKACDAAAYLGFTENWLARLRMAGAGPVFLRIGGGRKIRYRRADLEAWATANRYRSTSEYQQATA
jgi:predicted DNA-binding transcriptional regulator AlpA